MVQQLQQQLEVSSIDIRYSILVFVKWNKLNQWNKQNLIQKKVELITAFLFHHSQYRIRLNL